MSKYAALAALGEMAKGAGGFFGQMHVEKVKNERLAQARAERLEDIKSQRAWQAEQEADRREYAAGVRDEQREYAEGVLEEEREYAATLREEDLADADFDAAMEHQRDLELIAAREEAKGTGGSGTNPNKKQTEGQRKMELNARSSQEGLDDLRAIYSSDKYKLTSTGGFIDQYTAGKGPLNALASETGQQRKRAEGQLKEGLLRTATGAAAPVSEHGQYATMFIPVWGDDPKVVERKLAAAQEQINYIMSAANAAGPEMPQDEADRLWKSNMDTLAAKHGFEVPKSEMQQTGDDVDAFMRQNGIITQ